MIQQVKKPATQIPGMSLTQSAATLIKSTRKDSTRWVPLDKLLGGGLTRGHILELSGPPSCPKENICVDIAASLLKARENVIFVGTKPHPRR